MLSRNDVIRVAQENGFEDVGFTTAEPFESHREFLTGRQEEYGWAEQVGLDLMKGTDPKAIMPDGAKRSSS
jgi:epoxyqueuosine reductase